MTPLLDSSLVPNIKLSDNTSNDLSHSNKGSVSLSPDLITFLIRDIFPDISNDAVKRILLYRNESSIEIDGNHYQTVDLLDMLRDRFTLYSAMGGEVFQSADKINKKYQTAVLAKQPVQLELFFSLEKNFIMAFQQKKFNQAKMLAQITSSPSFYPLQQVFASIMDNEIGHFIDCMKTLRNRFGVRDLKTYTYDDLCMIQKGFGTPLMQLIEENKLQELFALIEYSHVNPHEKHLQLGGNALFSAVKAKIFKVLAYLIEVCNLEVDSRRVDFSTPLFHAIKEGGDIQAITYLLDHKADPNIKTKKGVTPLMAAAIRGDLEIIVLLFERGADVEIASNCLKTTFNQMFAEALEKRDFDKAKLLTEIFSKMLFLNLSRFFKSIAEEDIGHFIDCMKIIKKFHKTKMYEIYTNEQLKMEVIAGNTSLAVAIALRDYEKFYHFIEHYHINPHEENTSWGGNALFAAVYPGQFKFLSYLIEICGLDVNSRMKDGSTPLFTALESNDNVKTITYLLDHGADPNIETGIGDTLLKKAIRIKSHEVRRLLISRGADIHFVDKVHQTTPMMEAVLIGDLDAVKELKGLGCNINARDKFGQNCICKAVFKKNQEMLQYLVNIGSEITESDMAFAYKRKVEIPKPK